MPLLRPLFSSSPVLVRVIVIVIANVIVIFIIVIIIIIVIVIIIIVIVIIINDVQGSPLTPPLSTLCSSARAGFLRVNCIVKSLPENHPHCHRRHHHFDRSVRSSQLSLFIMISISSFTIIILITLINDHDDHHKHHQPDHDHPNQHDDDLRT